MCLNATICAAAIAACSWCLAQDEGPEQAFEKHKEGLEIGYDAEFFCYDEYIETSYGYEPLIRLSGGFFGPRARLTGFYHDVMGRIEGHYYEGGLRYEGETWGGTPIQADSNDSRSRRAG